MKRKAIEYNAPLNDSEDENDNDNDNNDHISVQHKKFIRLNEPNDNNAISNTFVPSNSKNFEAAVIKRLKEIINSNDRNNKKSIRDHIYKVCIELKDQYDKKSNFGKGWITAFQKRHKLHVLLNTKNTNNNSTKNTKNTNNNSTKNTNNKKNNNSNAVNTNNGTTENTNNRNTLNVNRSNSDININSSNSITNNTNINISNKNTNINNSNSDININNSNTINTNSSNSDININSSNSITNNTNTNDSNKNTGTNSSNTNIKKNTKNTNKKNTKNSTKKKTKNSKERIPTENATANNEITYSINHEFEAAILNYLKTVVPLNRSNSTFLYHHSQIQNICLELRDQYNVATSKFSNTWTSSFQSRYNLTKGLKIEQPVKKKCKYCSCSSKSLSKKVGQKTVLISMDVHEATCPKNPSLSTDQRNETNNTTSSSIKTNSPSKMTKTKLAPTLLDLFLLKKLRSKKHENIIHDYRNKNVNMTKESLIEDWNMMNDEAKSKIKFKVSNGNHIRKKRLLVRVRQSNKPNIEKQEYEMSVPAKRSKIDYIPKPDNECNLFDESKQKGLRSLSSIKRTGENSNLEQQKRVVAKLLNGMTMIPKDDKFILKNFNKQRVIEANENITNISNKLNNFLNM